MGTASCPTVVNIGFNNIINFTSLSVLKHNCVQSFFFFFFLLRPSFLFYKELKRDCHTISFQDRFRSMNRYLYTESSSTLNSSRWGLEDGGSRGTKSQSPSHFPTGAAHGAAGALPALHNGSSCLNTAGTKREIVAGASLLALKRCLKKSYLGSAICEG